MFLRPCLQRKSSLIRTRTCAWLVGGWLHHPAAFMHAASSPAHLHNCGLCSCRSAAASTCPTPDCKTPRRPGCSCRRLPPPRTASCSRRTLLSGSMDKKNSKVGGHFAKQHLTNDDMGAAAQPGLRYRRCVDTCSCRPPVASCCCSDHKPRNFSSPGGRRGRLRRTADLSARLRLQRKINRWRSVYLTALSETEA